MARKDTTKPPASPANADDERPTPRVRCRLRTIEDVRAELARLYREGKSGARDVADVSRLANVLSILGRLIEGSELEQRLDALEAAAEEVERESGAPRRMKRTR